MARPDHLWVFAYDIRRDSDRTRLASVLEEHLDRVQRSVFEGRLTLDAARRLVDAVTPFVGPEDSLRCYCVPEAGRRISLVRGTGTLPEADDFVLL